MAEKEAQLINSSKYIVFINGRFLPESQASISVFDHAFLYGDGVFDTSCAWNGYIFMLDEHLQRLYRSIHAMQIDFEMPLAELKELIVTTVRKNNLKNAYIKVVVSRGVSPEPLLDPRNCKTSLVIFARPYIYWVNAEKVKQGIRAKIVSIRRVPHECIDPKVKSLNYLNIVLAKMEAINCGYDDAIMLDSQGYVCEGPGYNIFAVSAEGLITPSSGILKGITRVAVFEIAERLKVNVIEGMYTPYDFYTAQEAFFSSTAGGIIPITEIDGRAIGTGKIGSLTGKITAAYFDMLTQGEHGTLVYR